jgi:hypothetical protein
MLTSCKVSKPGDEPFKARSMGLGPEDRHPIHSEGEVSMSPGLNATFTLLCPRSSGLVSR